MHPYIFSPLYGNKSSRKQMGHWYINCSRLAANVDFCIGLIFSSLNINKLFIYDSPLTLLYQYYSITQQREREREGGGERERNFLNFEVNSSFMKVHKVNQIKGNAVYIHTYIFIRQLNIMLNMLRKLSIFCTTE